MGRLKIKDIEGDESDVSNFFQKNGCDLAKYLGAESPQLKIPNKWIGIMTCIFFVLAACIWVDIFNMIWTKIAVLGLFLLCSLIVLAVHYNFKNWSLTAIAGLSGLIAILMVLNVYTPQEIAKKIEDTIKRHEEKK
jgi:hypothetical protein